MAALKMNGVSFGAEASKSSVKDEFLTLIKGFDPQEIEDVLSQTLCDCCQLSLLARMHSVANGKRSKNLSISSLSHSRDMTKWCSESSSEVIQSSSNPSESTPNDSSKAIHSGSRKQYADKFSPASVTSKHLSSSNSSRLLDDKDENERSRVAKIGRKKDFVYFGRIHGKKMNVLQGLELHTQVFNPDEQKEIVEFVYELQRMGQKGQLRERTYTEPSKWMRGKGRVTIQFGCCYNYAVDKYGNPPGIMRDEEVDPLPPLFKQMIKRMVRWHVLPPTCVPDSCIVNMYDEGDCIPPHIDHHDFLRPFCTISFLTECNILFGTNLKVVGPGEFDGPVCIPLPVGSVLVLKGNGADVAKHCVPAVPAKRISITFRKMDETKIPHRYAPEPELQRVQPVVLTPPSQQKPMGLAESNPPSTSDDAAVSRARGPSFVIGEDDFPPLGVVSASRQSGHRNNISTASLKSVYGKQMDGI